MSKSHYTEDYSKSLFSFGLFADCQYADKQTVSNRQYRLSLRKLEEIVNVFNQRAVKFIVNLGDLIDEKIESFAPMQAILKRCHHKIYHILGNHDYNVADLSKTQIPAKLELSDTYYSFIVNNWRFVLLDGNQISFYVCAKTNPLYQRTLTYHQNNKIHSPDWNGAMDAKQLEWLKSQLNQASDAQQNVVILNHFPIFPKDVHNLWNAKEVLQIIETYPCVKAYIAGHNHGGKYDISRKSHIPYLTLKAVVDTQENAFSVCHIFSNHLVLEGFGRESFKGYKKSESLRFNNK